MSGFCADLRAHGFDDLADMYDDGFDKFTYVRELQRALQLTLHRVAEIETIHTPELSNEFDFEWCRTCGPEGGQPGDSIGWPCLTRQALDGQPILTEAAG